MQVVLEVVLEKGLHRAKGLARETFPVYSEFGLHYIVNYTE